MPELTAILKASRDKEHSTRVFHAAIQGIDLEKESGAEKDAWKELEAKLLSGGAAENADDILALQGMAAQKAGFGIGMGLEMEVIDADGNVTKHG